MERYERYDECEFCNMDGAESLIYDHQPFGMLGNMQHRIKVIYHYDVKAYMLTHRVKLFDDLGRLTYEQEYPRAIHYCPMCGRKLDEEGDRDDKDRD